MKGNMFFSNLAGCVLTLLLTMTPTQESQSLEKELIRLGTETALVLPSQAVDEYPLWSTNGDYLAANLSGEWIKVNLQKIILIEATWRGKQKIGIIISQSSVSQATAVEIEAWKKISKQRYVESVRLAEVKKSRLIRSVIAFR